MAVDVAEMDAPELAHLPQIEITPELLAQAIRLIQSGQVAGVGADDVPAWQMQADAPILDELVAPDKLGDQMFYRQTNGWITSGPVGKARSRMNAYRNQGWTPLEEYGQFDLGHYYAAQPFEVLFIRGGAKEMPIDQVMALGFHLHPPAVPRCRTPIGAEHKGRTRRPAHSDLCWKGAKPVGFPQLAGLTFTKPEQCEFCERDDFASDRVRMQHIRVAHKDEMKEIAAAREMAKAVSGVMVGQIKGTALPSRQPFVCGLCSEGFDKPKQLTDHVKLCADATSEDVGAAAE